MIVIAVDGLAKRFGEVQALVDVSLEERTSDRPVSQVLSHCNRIVTSESLFMLRWH